MVLLLLLAWRSQTLQLWQRVGEAAVRGGLYTVVRLTSHDPGSDAHRPAAAGERQQQLSTSLRLRRA